MSPQCQLFLKYEIVLAAQTAIPIPLGFWTVDAIVLKNATCQAEAVGCFVLFWRCAEAIGKSD